MANGGGIDCKGYFSFDGTHFTAQVQRGIARDIVQVLGVLEPANWTMLIAGLGLVCTALRLRVESLGRSRSGGYLQLT